MIKTNIKKAIARLNGKSHVSWTNSESQLISQYSIKALYDSNTIGYITLSVDNGDIYIVTMLDEFSNPIATRKLLKQDTAIAQLLYYGALINRLNDGDRYNAYR